MKSTLGSGILELISQCAASTKVQRGWPTRTGDDLCAGGDGL